MCLIVFAWQVVPGVPLIAAANRDEFYERAAAPAAPWPEFPHVFAGRDLKAGGSWMGITPPGGGLRGRLHRGPAAGARQLPRRR
ncbi:NRDE family protein [Pseudoduganella sp. UC29_106]|uniref:NRDE family protein n=1 Tax=Pseudoduganella sp. UC29_106 TaxID=3374553 RepID=UPI003757310E